MMESLQASPWPAASRATVGRGVLTARGKRALLLAGDLAIAAIALTGALAVWAYRAGEPFTWRFMQENWLWFPFLAVTGLVSGALNDLYRPEVASRTRVSAVHILRSQALLLIASLVLYFVSEPASLPRGLVVYYLVISSPLMLGWRAALGKVLWQSRWRPRVLVVGAGWSGETIAKVLGQRLANDYTVVGFVDDDEEKAGQTTGGLPVLGTGASLPRLVQSHGISMLVVAITHSIQPELFQAILACQQAGVGVLGMTSVYEDALQRTPVHHLNERWFLEFQPPDLLTQAAKRAMDVAFGIVALAGFAVLLPVLALAVLLDSGRPIFYRQTRVGRNGREFTIYKLRTMVTDAEKDGAQWATKADPRVTRVGRFMRKARLDELPQAWCVLKGDMSLVGPRPERPEFIAELEGQIPYYRSRLSVKPGLTGWAQVRYRYGNTVEDALAKLEHDLYYIKHQSLLLDVTILFKTVGVVAAMAGT